VTAIALLLLAAALGYGVARWLGLPAIPLLVLGGILLNLLANPDQALLQDSLVLGIAFLVFVAGAELSPARVGAQKRAAFFVGAAHFILLGWAGFAAARLLGLDSQPAAYVTLALTASSTLIGVRLLQGRGQLFEPFGRLVIGVLLLQDIGVILMIPVVTRMEQGWRSVAQGMGLALGLLALSWVCLRWVTPPLVRRLARNEEGLLLAVLGILFVFLGISDQLGVPLVVGAFLAGLSLSPFPVNGLARGQVEPIADFFSALFFTALGAFLVLPTPAQLAQATLLTLMVLVLTPPLVAFVAERTEISARPAILSGLLLSQGSEFSFVVGLQGLVLGQLDAGVFTLISLVTVFTMVLTPLIATDRVTLQLMKLHPSSRARAPETIPEGHVLLVGAGANGMPILETLVIGPHPVVVIDDDPAVVERVRQAGIQSMGGDATDPRLLARAGADRALVVISTIRRPIDNGPLLRAARGRPVLVRTFSEEEAQWVREHGGTPILYSEAAAADFLSWFEGRR
jgi:Kef-type K+ transport system membrane component KefB